MNLDWSVLGQYASWIRDGVLMTLWVSFLAMVFALILGLIIGLLRMSPLAPVRWLAALYVQIFRGIPLFVFLLWTYFGLAFLLNINFDAVVAGVLCLTIQYAAFLAEIYRSGISAIDKGQREAAASLGMSSLASFRYVIFPQALRIIVPPIGNMAVGMVKDSSLVAVIGVAELTRQAQVAVSETYRPFEFYTCIAVIYIALTLGLAYLVRLLERRLHVDRLRQPGLAGRFFALRARNGVPDLIAGDPVTGGLVASDLASGDLVTPASADLARTKKAPR